MARTYKSKDAQTNPSKSGVKNMPKDYEAKHKEKGENDKGVSFMADLFKLSVSKMHMDHSAWTPEDVAMEIKGYFEYCDIKQLKPYMNGICLYMGMSKSTMYEWMANPTKYGAKSDILTQAKMILEGQYVDRSEKYPTANLFMLRAGHNYIETSKLDVQTTPNTAPNVEELADAVKKLGLDKK